MISWGCFMLFLFGMLPRHQLSFHSSCATKSSWHPGRLQALQFLVTFRWGLPAGVASIVWVFCKKISWTGFLLTLPSRCRLELSPRVFRYGTPSSLTGTWMVNRGKSINWINSGLTFGLRFLFVFDISQPARSIQSVLPFSAPRPLLCQLVVTVGTIGSEPYRELGTPGPEPYHKLRMQWGTPGPEQRLESRMLDGMSECMSNNVSDRMSNLMLDKMSDRMPDRPSEYMSDRMSVIEGHSKKLYCLLHMHPDN